MRRPTALAFVAALFVALIVAWLVTSTEWGEVTLPTPLRGEAATNPFYAAQRLVDALGATSERRESLGDTPTDAVVLLSTFSWDVDTARREALERWVESGGRLVVDAALLQGSDAFEQWSGIVREREEIDPEERDLFEPPEIVEPCRQAAEVLPERPSLDSRFEVCGFDLTSWLETRTPLLWGLDDEGYLVAARVAVGRGTVTMLNGVPFVYRELFEGEHGELLAAATELRAGDRVVFMSEADVASLLELVWRHGAPVVSVLLLFIALGLWRGAMRFGPLVAAPERARRSLAEQILGTGRFAVRVGGGAALLAAARRAFDEAAARRVAGYNGLANDARIAAVARAAGLDARELASAMQAESNQRSLELRAKLALLETARRQLVATNRWSSHGKRI